MVMVFLILINMNGERGIENLLNNGMLQFIKKDKERVRSAGSGVTWRKLPQAIKQVETIEK